MSTLSERLRELRGPTSQSEMARTLKMPRPQWIRYETGLSTPGADILANICRVHACSADWLLGLNDRGGSTVIGNNNAVGANARVTVRSTTSAYGKRHECTGCPYKQKLKEFEAFFTSTTSTKGKRK